MNKKRRGEVEQLAIALGEDDLFSKYVMATSQLDPEYYVSDVMRENKCDRMIEDGSLDLLEKFLRKKGVTGGHATIDDVIEGWEMKSSPGPGYTNSFGSRADILPFVLAQEYDADAAGKFAVGIVVKEETCKKEKYDRGDYRIILNNSTYMLFWGKMMNFKFGQQLAETGVMFKGVDLRVAMHALVHFALRSNLTIVIMDAHKMDRTIRMALMYQIYSVIARFRKEVPAYMHFYRRWKFWCRKEGKPTMLETETAYPSGKDHTSEEETLLVIGLVLQWISDIGRLDLLDDLFIRGCGDDTLLLLPMAKEGLSDSLRQHFASYGLDMEVSVMQGVEDVKKSWDLMGSTIVETPRGLYPVWSYKKSIFRWAFDSRRESEYERILRMAQALNYLVFHPKYEILRNWVYDQVFKSTLTLEQKTRVFVLVETGERSYTIAQRLWMKRGMSVATPTPEKEIARELRRNHATEAGLQWLEAVIDPFHDSELDVTGIPDHVNGRSVVQVFKTEYTITKPGTLPSGSTWDAHIFFTGQVSVDRSDPCAIIYDPPSNGSTGSSPKVAYAYNNSFNYGGVCVMTAPAGVDMDPSTNGSFGSQICLSPYQTITGDYTQLPPGRARLIAGGFEVSNTTASLYKGGSVCGYRLQNLDDDLAVKYYKNDNENLFQVYKPHVCPLPPENISKAVIIPDSVTHEAEKGAYMAWRLSTDDVPISRPSTTQRLFMREMDTDGTTQPLLGICSHFPDSSKPWEPPAGSFLSKFHPCGIYFTGLAEQSALRLSMKWYVEYFPGVSEQNLLVLAKRSPTVDHLAMETYFAQIRQMPTMVTFAENGMGKWFRRVLSGVKKAAVVTDRLIETAGPALAMMGGPQAQEAMAAYEGIKMLGSEIKRESKAKRKAAKERARERARQNLEATRGQAPLDRARALVRRPRPPRTEV